MRIESDVEALRLALRPGISGKVYDGVAPALITTTTVVGTIKSTGRRTAIVAFGDGTENFPRVSLWTRNPFLAWCNSRDQMGVNRANLLWRCV
jgi:hypothetical protein